MTKTPNQDLYNSLKPATKTNYEKVLQLWFDATWHVVKQYSKAQEDHDFQHMATAQVQSTWYGFEDFLKQHPRKVLASLHLSIFKIAAPTEAKMSHESLATIIWNYRILNAIDHTQPAEGKTGPGGTPERHSSIGGRIYKVGTPNPAIHKPYTSKAGVACYNIIVDCCKDTGQVIEADLKVKVMERAKEITPKTESAWRFLQFYRPLLVEAGMIEYVK